ncbi:hypothetical protein [Amycolatopsis sp. 195334CR]|uniref:hypothetical protein n=1 Tax=Amycolatopsis sp. 195334CR TaxID=2814588 RepID=UPI001A8C83C6|nr:hypothetical protein [Amycolatopsis sp. 195334CR]MBN6034090.1 hypothetical protein [Amycolatopsis sp. 195334CR]
MIRVLALVLAGMVGTAVPAGSAQAADRATHYVTHDLTPQPWEEYPGICVPAKEISLAKNRYDWGVWFAGSQWGAKEIDLDADTYYWGLCIEPRDGDYLILTSLDPKRPGAPTAHFKAPAGMADGPIRPVTWGSFLDPR